MAEPQTVPLESLPPVSVNPAGARAGIRFEKLGTFTPEGITAPSPDGDRPLVAANEDAVFLANGADGLLVLDPTDPSAVAVRAEWTGDPVLGVHLEGNLLFAAIPEAGFRILDMSDPAAPEERGVIPIEGRMDVEGDFVYVVDRTIASPASLRIFDVSDADSPQQVGSFVLYGAHAADAVAVVDGHAYVSAGVGGLYVLDVYDPTDPQFRGQWSLGVGTNGSAFALRAGGGYLYAFMGENADSSSVRIIDIADPSAPFSVALLGELGRDAVTIGGENRAYLIAQGGVGLQALDLNGGIPMPVGGYATSVGGTLEYGRSLALSGDRIYLVTTEGSSGAVQMHILQAGPLEGASLFLAGARDERKLRASYPDENLFWIERSPDLISWAPLQPFVDVAAWALSGTGDTVVPVEDVSISGQSSPDVYYRLGAGWRLFFLE